MKPYYFISSLLCIFINFSCAQTRHTLQTGDINHLKFLDEYVVPFNKSFQNTTIGGLSGIDYDPKQQVYYLISDDRSQENPARFYVAKIFINADKIDSVGFIDTKFLKNNVGKLYPNSHQDPFRTPDPEAMRYNQKRNTLVWSSEGERIVRTDKIVLENPAVTEINTDGNYIDTFTLPPQLHMHSTESGPRQNGVFEGVTFTDNYKTLFASVEEPLYNDGLRA
ncbi:MAG: esterase-like activity of phytase family protein, partial [Bacteroidota bacterium]|nr:esterase-like activity of phytase family protein [Bacteroidota bacterium]